MESISNGEVLTKSKNEKDVQHGNNSEVIKTKNPNESKLDSEISKNNDNSKLNTTTLKSGSCEVSICSIIDQDEDSVQEVLLLDKDLGEKESSISGTGGSKTSVVYDDAKLPLNLIAETGDSVLKNAETPFENILNKDEMYVKENGISNEPKSSSVDSGEDVEFLLTKVSKKHKPKVEDMKQNTIEKTVNSNEDLLKRKLAVSDEPETKKSDIDSSVSESIKDIVNLVEKQIHKTNQKKRAASGKAKSRFKPALNTSKKLLLSGESVSLNVEHVDIEKLNSSASSLTGNEVRRTDSSEEMIDISMDGRDTERSSSISSDDNQPLDFVMKNNKKSLEKDGTKPTSDSVNCLVDLLATKSPLEGNSRKATPTGELNEPVKSQESNKELKSRLINKPKDDDSLLNPVSSDLQVCDKENNCMDTSLSKDEPDKDSTDSFIFADLSNEETGFPDVFTGLVTIGKYISVKGDFTLRSSEALVESPSLVAPYLLKEPDSFPNKEKDSKSEEKMKDFFHSAAGEILVGIGLSRVTEWFHRDMVRIKKRQMKRNGKSPELEEELAKHENFLSAASKANNVYSFDVKSCKTCGFTTESEVVLEGHLLVPHITQRREYQCNYCDAINRDPKGMMVHMQQVHQKQGRIQPPVLFFECPSCVFESNSKVKLNNHLIKCQRLFDIGINQAPPRDFEFPALTPKPITVAVVKAYEKSLGCMQRGRGRPKKDPSDPVHSYSSTSSLTSLASNHMAGFRSSSPLTDSLSMHGAMMSPLQMPNMNIRPGQLHTGISPMHMTPSNRFFQVVNSTGQIMPLMGNNHLAPSPSQFPFSPNLNNSLGKKTSSTTPYFNSVFDGNLRQQSTSKTPLPNMTITPLPKLTGPYPVPTSKSSPSAGTPPMQPNHNLVVCEICDGYIKDLEQLRTHMQLIHKVKIHPKMLVSRPPLNCQKCQWRFFTDQGLERHLLGSHGLVTSNMQELSNKGKDAGCCTICGRVYATKLVSHMNQVHKISLKPAHLSYKCTVCSATFNLYRLFENHVYLVHSGAAKRATDGRSSPLTKRLKTSSDNSSQQATDENKKNCKDCGSDMSNDKSLTDKCGKCLNSKELAKGTKT